MRHEVGRLVSFDRFYKYIISSFRLSFFAYVTHAFILRVLDARLF